ncbi:GTPase HflX [Rhodohalobacter sp. SW132]|uniref:GTPase HflX n=1 Tax=Rhodohalobacter sp. SW132 TaxID=2293433 RepID=UPI000E27EBEC|nr:GTPase HflX [Rhodohalobacter sp. SW132]REL24854.1 GTPase HflX [Rhodohalobacter sp. SW132]
MLEDVRKPSITKEKAILVGIYGPDTPKWLAGEYLDELELLADTAGASTEEKVLQNRPQPDPSTYIGKGKLNQLKAKVSETGSDLLIFDDDLTATQVRNIEKTANVKVLDRSGLILDIFASRAKTSAAKTQVELAQLQYLLPRLTRFWTHLSRQKGGIGTKGPGETQIETDRRLIGERISTLKDKLEKLDRQRTTQRKGRSENPRVALVGYTNAGKSTLMNALTDTNVLAEDRLFATLDSTVRRLELENHDILLSDTVGFIRKLPHNLIESFKSTLDEVREADLLLHVVDASSNLIDDYIDVVNTTLEELDIKDVKKVLVFNKIDKVEPSRLMELKKGFPGAIFVSAERSMGLDKLQGQIELMIEEDYHPFVYTVPMAHYKAVAFLHDVGVVDSEHFEGNSVTIKGSITEADRNRFDAMLSKLETAVI